MHQSPEEIYSYLLSNIIQIRELQTAQSILNDTTDLKAESLTTSWAHLFSQGFLTNLTTPHASHGPSDDLLFFVNRQANSGTRPELRVLRKNSPNLPSFDDPSINWEQTVYLNLLMQYFVYVVTVAICTRTGPQEVQILKKFSETVYASPNRRRMDRKGTREEVVYPDLFFSIENYNEIFSECTIRDSECICVELTAYDLCGRLQGVCFLGTIQYGSLRKFYDSKISAVSVGYATPLFGRQRNIKATQWSTSSDVKFMQVLGPHGKGQAEFAISLVDNPIDCQCTANPGSSLMNRCCFCQTSPSVDNVAFETIQREPITEQPKESPDKFSPAWLSNEAFADWVCLSIPPESGESPRTIDCSSFFQLRSIPSAIHSAAGSTETSPTRRWRLRNTFNRGSVTSLIGSDEVGSYPNGTRKPRGFHSSRYSPRVSQILGRFVRPESTSAEVRQADTELDVLVGDGMKKPRQNDDLQDAPVINTDNSVLFHGPERHRRSFGQSWSWFKERRRITSPALNVALTSLNLPSHNILSDLIEARREPILTITD